MIAKSPVPIRQSFMPIGNSRPNRKLGRLLGVTIHNTGNYSKGANAEMHRRYQHGSGAHNYTSYHYVVDDKEIIQLVPEHEVTYHAGDGGKGPGNTQTISIEICVNSDGDIKKATDNATWLTADILFRHGLAEKGKIYQHYDWSRKNCPMEIRKGNPYGMDFFVSKVNDYLFPKVTKSVDDIAKEVVAGVWGNNPFRKQKLIQAGYNYNEIQKRVDELYHGAVKQVPNKPTPAPPKKETAKPKVLHTKVLEPKTVEKFPHIRIIKDVAKLWAFDFDNWADAKEVKEFKKGEELEVATVVTNELGGEYYVTPYSHSRGIRHGVNVADAELFYKEKTN